MIKKRPPCPHCGATRARNNKVSHLKDGRKVTQYRCRNCGKHYTVPLDKIRPPARVLILDVETAPMTAYVWSLWKNDIHGEQQISDWFCLTWAAKWLFESEVMSAKITPDEVARQDDKRIMSGVWSLLEEADMVIAHNGSRFDIPKINTRFLIHGMSPPMPYQQIDTLKVLKREFAFSSNRLDYVNKAMSLNRKLDTGGFELWAKCMDGDRDALSKMEEYNVMDVQILEEFYVELRPWIKSHPNMNLFVETEEEACPTCGCTGLDYKGYYHTNVGKYESFRCKGCGAIGRRRRTVFNKEKNRTILTSIAR